MTMMLDRTSYQDVLAGDLAWLEKTPRSLERDHIEQVVRASLKHEYDDPAELAGAHQQANALRRERDDARTELASVRSDSDVLRADMEMAAAGFISRDLVERARVVLLDQGVTIHDAVARATALLMEALGR